MIMLIHLSIVDDSGPDERDPDDMHGMSIVI